MPASLGRVVELYHFTDTRNLPSIRARGGLYSMQLLKQMGVQGVIPGGNDWSLSADQIFGMDQYVHLCMRRNHPMEYRAKERGQIQRTLWLTIDAANIFNLEGVLFSYDVSNSSGVKICPLQEAAADIDYDILYGRADLRDPELQSRMSKAERCEILVPKYIPIQYFERFLPNG
jgi:hypothetical protein